MGILQPLSTPSQSSSEASGKGRPSAKLKPVGICEVVWPKTPGRPRQPWVMNCCGKLQLLRNTRQSPRLTGYLCWSDSTCLVRLLIRWCTTASGWVPPED